MEAHRSVERFEHGHRVSAGGDGEGVPPHARNAALAVAVMAAFLAIAIFLSNEAVKHVITGETHRAETSAQLETNRVKIDVAGGNSVLLRVLGKGGLEERRAATEAGRHEARITEQLKPADARLGAQARSYSDDTDHANAQHIYYELAEVGLQVGIVLATVSIIARRRWLLGAGGAVATGGVALLLIGLLLA
jgi:hypothetical protein